MQKIKIKTNKKTICAFHLLEEPKPGDAVYIYLKGGWLKIVPIFEAFIRGIHLLPKLFWVVETFPIDIEKVEKIESTILVEPLTREELEKLKMIAVSIEKVKTKMMRCQR